MLQLHVVECPVKRGRPRVGPTAEDVRAARERAGLSVEQAADLVHATVKAWNFWESGGKSMHPAFWELFSLKARQLH